ncbi:MAG: MerR family DNA-binding transcriptional regulator [Brevibacterium sp.]|uniref:MerR family DNA-binding transcriptional regulator n=1 Tax=Brevibacterium sp. TaxID=1701 RepID=UPI00264835FF|nr:MerR family DNA-binding transcriptional regulator [Brevibacterium sp.]MDN5834568.1 MerR family DNA-binding transcriptional regulator [Brevibacterium sp.]MDN5875124.1 MerR family DNA-binding transcriptional regulator [Brevibacterium sp.]MDN5908303.1 MerR family DNA-binding transcriptional regulator [Brevibacterium sp.]MDN6133705.1 MerR family DNA-binding transcriptional regulator [Brevibacterium sp.]MDN6157795.1 MerR family DNA-binding transcriptional regulator [Brevibacterium sp.]
MLIGEVAKRSGVSARMLRHYESLGLIDPSERTPNGYREYSAADIGRIFHIEGLRKLGMSLAEIGTLLNDPAFDPSLLIHELIETSRRRIAVEQELLSKLERIDRLHHADGEALLLTIDLMRSLESGDVIQRHKAALGSGVDGTVPVESLSAVVLNDPVLNAAGAMRWALAQSGPEAIRYLAKGMGDLSVEVRRNALQALDEIRRNTAKEELGSVAEATIIESLHSGLGDTDLQVRSSAALILGQMADPVAVSDLLEIAMDGPKDIEAAEALAAFVNEAPEEGARAEVATRIMSDLRRHARSPEATVRFRVLQVLIEIPGTEVDDFIVELSTDENLEVAATATATLNRRRDH